MYRKFAFLFTFTLILFSNGNSQDVTAPASIQELIRHYEADKRSLSRFYFIPNSPERRQRFKLFYQEYEFKLSGLPFDRMDVSDRVDYILLNRSLNNELQKLQQEEEEYGRIGKFVSFGEYIYDLERLRRRGATPDAPAVAAALNRMTAEVRIANEMVMEGGNFDASLSDRATQTVRGWRTALKSVHDFYNGYDPSYTWWVARPYKELDSLLGIYAVSLTKKSNRGEGQPQDGSGIVGKPIGAKELSRQLQFEMVPYSAEELIDIANREFAWCNAEMLKASRDMGFGNDWKKALEKVKNSYVPEGKQPEMIMELYRQSVDFLKENDLITIPPLAEETWDMVMMSPERQLVAPFFLGGETLLIAYPTNSMEQEAKMMSLRGNNPHFSRAVVHHELIAGHRLQAYMTDRYKTYRNFWTPFWTEGWALYWEMILWDKHFPRSPEDRVGMLFWRMHRCARIIFSLSYHLGKWTPQQCIDFLVEKVGHERANAEGEVRRSFTGGYGPLYQLAYMIGALQFYELKRELVDSGKFSFKEFHDAVMKENSMPVEMLRAILTNQQLTRDFKSYWRFYRLEK